MITVNCLSCGMELEVAGGLLISPPLEGAVWRGMNDMVVVKNHLCVWCYDIVHNFAKSLGHIYPRPDTT